MFETLTLLETQDVAIWRASPWREDPYHTALSVTQFVVPVLASAIAARLLVGRASGSRDRVKQRDRVQQMVRAAGTMTALIGLALVAEWAAVVARPPGSSWTTVAWLLTGGLVLASAATVVGVGLLLRCRRAGGRSGGWQHDWLGDLPPLCRPVPGLRRWVTPVAVERVRRRAMTAFLVLSILAGTAITAAQTIGERVTDPFAIAWFLVAGTAANFACFVLSNAFAGFIARPPRAWPRRVAEVSAVAGCLALVVAIAFHGTLWRTLGSGPLTFPALAALTLGTGLGTSLVTAGLLIASRLARSPRGGAASIRSLSTPESRAAGERRTHEAAR